MLGYSRKERNTKLAKQLGYDNYDDARYVKLATEKGLEPLSIKQVAINYKLATPMADKSPSERGLYTRPENIVAAFLADPLMMVLKASEKRMDFKNKEVARANRDLEKKVQPYLDIMQEVLTNGAEMVQQPNSYMNPDMTLFMSDIEVSEEQMEENDYCYTTKQTVELGFRGKYIKLAA